jgi:ADP-ribose pyrophosphatase
MDKEEDELQHNTNVMQDLRMEQPACTDLLPISLEHENSWFSVFNRGGYFTVEYHFRQVIILPVVEKQSFLMVRAKRPVINDVTLELPAGCIESGERPVVGAARELFEETGVDAGDFSRFKLLPPLAYSPNRSPSLAYNFQVDLTQNEINDCAEHDDEIERVELVSFADVVRKMMLGEIYVTVPMAIIGRYLLQHFCME